MTSIARRAAPWYTQMENIFLFADIFEVRESMRGANK